MADGDHGQPSLPGSTSSGPSNDQSQEALRQVLPADKLGGMAFPAATLQRTWRKCS